MLLRAAARASRLRPLAQSHSLRWRATATAAPGDSDGGGRVRQVSHAHGSLGHADVHAHGGMQGHAHAMPHGSHGHSHSIPAGLSEDAQRAMSRITWVGVYTNLVLSVSKGLVGVAVNSSALIADAYHSLTDLLSDFVTLAVVKISRRPADSKYLYGYGKYEPLGALAVSILLVGGGVGIARFAYYQIVDFVSKAPPALPSPPGGASDVVVLMHNAADVVTGSISHPVAFGVIIASIAAKEWLFHATKRVAKQHRSQTLLANAWHHRSDAVSSVVALVGVAGSAAGIQVLDPIAGIIVAGMIVRAGADNGWNAFRQLLDANTADAARDDIEIAANEFAEMDSDITGVHRVRARAMGPNTLVDMHVQVNPLLSVSSAHHAGLRVRKHVMDNFPFVSEVLVHVDIDNDASPSYEGVGPRALPRSPSEISDEVRAAILGAVPDVRSVSHVACHYINENVLVEAQITVDDALSIADARHVAKQAKLTAERVPDVDEVHVDLELDGAHAWRLRDSRRKRELVEQKQSWQMLAQQYMNEKKEK